MSTDPPANPNASTSAGASKDSTPKRIAILSTGGTIAKTYNESDGSLANQRCVLELMLASLVLRGVTIDRVPVMNKDSLDMTPADHEHIASLAEIYSRSHEGVIIVHGTDRLTTTGETIIEHVGESPPVPIILTGALRPYELRTTDALQNLTESLLAAQLVEPGVYCVMHNQVLRFPGVVKDYEKMTFRRAEVTTSRAPS